MRSLVHPWGFPWLRGARLQSCKSSNDGVHFVLGVLADQLNAGRAALLAGGPRRCDRRHVVAPPPGELLAATGDRTAAGAPERPHRSSLHDRLWEQLRHADEVSRPLPAAGDGAAIPPRVTFRPRHRGIRRTPAAAASSDGKTATRGCAPSPTSKRRQGGFSFLAPAVDYLGRGEPRRGVHLSQCLSGMGRCADGSACSPPGEGQNAEGTSGEGTTGGRQSPRSW